MKNSAKIRFCALAAVILIAGSMAIGEDAPKNLQQITEGFQALVRTMPEGKLLAASSAVGSPAYHRHLVRAGAPTSYLLRVANDGQEPITVELAANEVSKGWNAELAELNVEVAGGEEKYVKVLFTPDKSLPKGEVGSLSVTASASNGEKEEVILEAEVTEKRKIYIISIDSLSIDYLKLNSKGNGWGSDGDWLMPNLLEIIGNGTFYPKHKVHLISATDGNHASYLSGAYPGRLGIYSVQVFFFGFDAKGRPKARSTPLDLMYYGEDGKPVTTIFNVAKDPALGGNKNAFAAYASGKAWVPEHYRNPVFGLDRIATVTDRPDYNEPCAIHHTGRWLAKTYMKVHVKKLKDPDLFAWEDDYTADQVVEIIENEDPDVMYILLSAVDMAGHAYGAGYDLSEWDDNGTPDDLSDDKSRINPHANREGIIKTVANADKQLGRIIDFLKERGTYDDAIIVVESDHNMETNYFDGPPLHKILAKAGYSEKKDYFAATVNQIGTIFLRRDDPKLRDDIEKLLEDYEMKNPITGRMEKAITVLNREEMRTGIDQRTGKRVSFPMEVYNEYWVKNQGKDGSLRWPDLLLLIEKYYQFPTLGFGLANVGASQIPVPPIHMFIGGHGSFSTQSALMTISGPGIPKGVINSSETHPADVAPTLYRLQGYTIPDAVQGKGLPGVDPVIQ